MHDDDKAFIADLLGGDPETVQQTRGWIRGAFTPFRQRLAAELEDLEQEILLDLTQALREDRFHGQCRLRTYVRTYVHHKSIDLVRAQDRREIVDLGELDLTSDSPTALDSISRAEELEMALRVAEEMPENCRELWQMLERGLRYQEMSRQLGVAEGTLRARVLRCRRRALELRDRLFSRFSVTKSNSDD